MKVYKGINSFEKLANAIVTSGFFDGVHKGHQTILTRINEIAKKENGESVVLTFWPHPRTILQPNVPSPPLLSTLDEKIKLIESCGIDHLIIIPFTIEFSQLSSMSFITDILVEKIGTKKLVIGYDHKFGKNREGSFEFLKDNSNKFGFSVEEISKQEIDNMAVSSTNIRNALLECDVATAAQYLGNNYCISGWVVRGKQLGKSIGYPTANIEIDDKDKLIPNDGIYTVKVNVEDRIYGGMLSIGYNPTVNGTVKTIEVNIFDFDQDIYGKTITTYFIEYLRKEEKFESLEALIKQLDQDKIDSLEILGK